MSSQDREYLTEGEASRLWQRAAQLQAEAARRAERESTDAPGSTAGDDPAEGFELEHVRTAALEAGISEEFVEAALADLRAERAVPAPGRRAVARAFLRDPPDALTVRRVLEASPEQVLDSMERVLPREPYRLTLADRQGDPVAGGVLVFDIQGAGATATEGLAHEAAWADFRQILASLQPLGEAPGACEVTLRAPVAGGHNLNTVAGVIMSGIAGGVGYGAGTLVAGGLAVFGFGPLVAAAAAAVTAGGALAGLAGGTVGYRAIYRYALRRGTRALEGMLSAVALEAEGGWGLPSDRASRALPEPEPGAARLLGGASDGGSATGGDR